MARSTVAVRFTGDTADLKRSLDGIDGKLRQTGSKLASFGKVAAVGLGGLAVGAGALAKGFVDAATESLKVTKQTEAVIKSMGNAAGVSAKEVGELSTALSLKTGVDDELIQSGSNVLLTFGQIRNAVGEGNDIFDQATAAALDMSVALGTDMTSASMMVGKALNDPVRGLTALRRSGIQFTKQQEEQIKVMAEAGDVAGAQKIMLAELQRQFGGSAAAQATSADKLKVAWGNLQEQLGAKLLPVVEKVAGWMADNLPGAMARAEVAFAKVKPVIESVIAAVRDNWPQIQATIVAVVTAVRGVIEGFVEVVATLWENFGDNILSFVERVWPAVKQTIEGVLKVIRGIVQTVTALIHGDWSAVWEGIKATVAGVWNAIQGIVRTALEVLRLVIGAALEVIGSAMKGAWDAIKSTVAGAWSSIKTTVSNAVEDVIGFVAAMPGRIGRFAATMWDKVKEAATAAKDWVLEKIDQMLGPIDEVLGKLGSIVGGNIGGRAEVQDYLRQRAGSRADSNARGTTNFRGGLTWVGEQGKELLNLPGGSQIIPHGPSMQMAGAGGGLPPIVLQVNLDGRMIAEVVHRHDALNARNRGQR